jgi:hypothetical protein
MALTVMPHLALPAGVGGLACRRTRPRLFLVPGDADVEAVTG